MSSQQEGLDDGPDFLSEEDRGVSAVRLPVCLFTLCLFTCVLEFDALLCLIQLNQLGSISSLIFLGKLAVQANFSLLLMGS